MKIAPEGLGRKIADHFALLSAVLLAAAMLFAVPGLALSAEAENGAEAGDGYEWAGEGEDGGILQPEDLEWIAAAREALMPIVRERDILALVYLCSSYEVRENAGGDSAVLATVFSGQTVNILDVEIAENETGLAAWAKVAFYEGGAERQGYIERARLACSDERFLAWEEEYGMDPGAFIAYTAEGEGSSEEAGPKVYPDIEQFPESYRAALTELKELHPLWIFVPFTTMHDWQTVIDNEIGGGKSLVHKSLPECVREGSYDGGNWYYASEDILKYYMDPRNGLTESRIFQFELLTYNETYHTEAALESFLNNTFMRSYDHEGNPCYAPGTVMTFAHIIWALGAQDIRQVSPFHLAARIYQEQGRGDSPLISGTYPEFEGYYNYFNVGASGKSNAEYIINGLTYARDHNWYSAYYSIEGGADVISKNYIRKKQDTLYLQKYNVNPADPEGKYTDRYKPFTHQYMQNISAPTTEGSKIKELYESADSLNNTFVFKIPVYENMPETACAYPTGSVNVTLQIPAGYDTTVWLDGVPCAALRREGRRTVVNAGSGGARSAVVYSYNESGIPVGMYVWTLDHVNNAYRATEQPELTDLLTYHGFSVRISGNSGIRFKTGIRADLKNSLAGDGVNGFHLKEYGTLAMINANFGSYPMVKGGQKVVSGLAYGTNAEGQLEDHVFETLDGRQRFTSVLVGLPADQYRTEFAFRGYLILEKDGAETVLYGPVVARSIYALSEQLLNMGIYPVGSEADIFLRRILADAAAAQ